MLVEIWNFKLPDQQLTNLATDITNKTCKHWSYLLIEWNFPVMLPRENPLDCLVLSQEYYKMVDTGNNERVTSHIDKPYCAGLP